MTAENSIILSHVAWYWIGLVKVLHLNKVPKVIRQVHSIDNKSNVKEYNLKDSAFRITFQQTKWTPKATSTVSQPAWKMVLSGVAKEDSDSQNSTGNQHRSRKLGRGKDVNNREQCTKDDEVPTNPSGPKPSIGSNLVIWGPLAHNTKSTLVLSGLLRTLKCILYQFSTSSPV